MIYGDEVNEKKKEYISELARKAKGKKLSYAEIGHYLENTELDKDQMEDIYEALMSKGIEVVSEEVPEEFELKEIETEIEEEVVPDSDKEEGEKEISLEKTIPKTVAVDDPVRMYLKEIGNLTIFCYFVFLYFC